MKTKQRRHWWTGIRDVKAIGHTAYIRLWRAMIRERQGKPIARPYRWTGLSEKILGHSEYVRLWRQKRKEQQT
jgi:hypothetical protein